MRRAAHLRRLREEQFDVVVVGGGITGAAAARDAARRGYRTALVEARDFGEGTSSRSSRLIHGGLRYLEQLELDLVFEASQERRTLLRIAPHLVRPLEFLFPLFEEGRVGKRKLDAGMWLYDALALFRNIERHQMLDTEEVLEREPSLREEGLLGGARYYDAQVDDARLVLTTVRGAAEAGAAVANRVEMTGVARRMGAVAGVRVREEGGESWTVDARCVLLAAGPWTEEALDRAGAGWGRSLRPTRGTHIHLRRDRLDHRRALIFESPLDQRIMFVLPWGDLTMVGTTDEDFDGRPEDVRPTARDVAYLIGSVNRLFPRATLDPGDVLAAWAGLRPLVAEEGAEEEDEVSRDFTIAAPEEGLLAIAGGKLTSHRHMAEELVNGAADFLETAFDRPPPRQCDTARVPLPGGDMEELEAFGERLRERTGGLDLPEGALDRLVRAHGTRAPELLALARADEAMAEPLVEGRPYLAAEAVHAARREMAVHVEDVVFRRTRLGWETRHRTGEGARRVAELMGRELGWDASRAEREVERTLAVRERDERFRGELESVWEEASGRGE